MQHHAYFIAAEVEEGIGRAEELVERELGMSVHGNPDVITLRYGLLTVGEARRLGEVALQGPLAHESRAIIVAASRAYHEAQNALLKLFEEPPPHTYLFLVLPSPDLLLPTLRSRVAVVGGGSGKPESSEATTFARMSKEKRSAFIKKLSTGDDDEERRLHREEALALVGALERVAYEKFRKAGNPPGALAAFLADTSALRGFLYDRSAPVRMILEHLALVLPKDLI